MNGRCAAAPNVTANPAMSPSLTVELRLPDDQLRALAALIAQSVGGSTGRATYTVAQAAQKTGQSEKTIRRHIEAGRIAGNVPRILRRGGRYSRRPRQPSDIQGGQRHKYKGRKEHGDGYGDAEDHGSHKSWRLRHRSSRP